MFGEHKRSETFGIHTCLHLREKMWRDYMRLSKAENYNQLRDFAIAFAITAHHLADWVWELHVSKDPGLMASLGVKRISDFVDYLCERCPPLRYCDILANAFKHGGVAQRRSTRPIIDSTLTAEIDIPEGKEPDLFVLMEKAQTANWTAHIVEHEKVGIEKICLEVARGWDDLLRQFDIGKREGCWEIITDL